ncbi:MAG: hypothetical protein ACD_43C00163G0003 [uncultured bacterium]|nr:MAG: hypothetical protein ACD_43C00163G0003 [uncultured bacterium]
MTNLLLQTFLFLLPAGMANMAPVVFRFIPWGNQPIDFGYMFHGRRMIGSQKTIRGFVSGSIMAVTGVYFIRYLWPAALLEPAIQTPILWGLALGFGALTGDAVKSFFKRQREIASGKSWPPFDQIDWIFGALFFTFPFGVVTWPLALTALLLFGPLHPLINIIGRLIGLKKNWL